MKLVVFIFALAGCASVHPVSQAPSAVSLMPQVSNPPINFNPQFRAAGVIWERVLPITYPPGLVTTNYWWDVEASSDLTTWVTFMRNVGPYDVTVRATNELQFFRMKGTP